MKNINYNDIVLYHLNDMQCYKYSKRAIKILVIFIFLFILCKFIFDITYYITLITIGIYLVLNIPIILSFIYANNMLKDIESNPVEVNTLFEKFIVLISLDADNKEIKRKLNKSSLYLYWLKHIFRETYRVKPDMYYTENKKMENVSKKLKDGSICNLPNKQ